MKKIWVCIAVVSMVFILNGCSTIQTAGASVGSRVGLLSSRSSGYPKISNTLKQGCAGGFAIGAGAAVLKGKRFEKILRDGVIGAIIGCTVAQGLNKRRENFANEADYYDTEIADAKNSNAEMQTLVDHTIKITKENRAVLASLQEDEKQKQLESTKISEANLNTRADLRWARKELETARSNLELQKEVSEQMVESGDSNRSNAMKAEVNQLEVYINSLEKEIANLASINDSIAQFSS